MRRLQNEIPAWIVNNDTDCKEELHPNQKLACFAIYLKIVNIFVQNNVYILNMKGKVFQPRMKNKLSKELKMAMDFY